MKGPPDSCHACCLCWGSWLWSAAKPLGTVLSVHLALSQAAWPRFSSCCIFVSHQFCIQWPKPCITNQKNHILIFFFFCVPAPGSVPHRIQIAMCLLFVQVLVEFNSVQQMCSELLLWAWFWDQGYSNEWEADSALKIFRLHFFFILISKLLHSGLGKSFHDGLGPFSCTTFPILPMSQPNCSKMLLSSIAGMSFFFFSVPRAKLDL